MNLQHMRAALFVTCAALASPALAQDGAARENHARFDRVAVYAKDTGEIRGYIDVKAFDVVMASPAVPAAVKQNLRTGDQWVITVPDGRPGVVGRDFECVRNPDFTGMPQCGDGNEDGVGGGGGDGGGDITALSLPRTQPALNRIAAAPAQPDPARSGRVAFTSADGSAVKGSRSVFILRNTANGETVLVPVEGNDGATRVETYLKPGTYEVIPPAPSVSAYRSFYTSKVSTAQITVNAGANPVVVDFSLGVKDAPVIMKPGKVTSDSVALVWGATAESGAQGYTLVRTDGETAATSPAAGTVVASGQANMTSAVAGGLSPDHKYTFTLFARAGDGSTLPARSVTVTTARVSGTTESSYAVAPNTIVPDNYASLRVEPVSDTSIRVALPANVRRGSSSDMPGVTSASLSGNGCMVGTPFLVTTDVAGDNSFYGLIDACEGPASGATSAIINRDVPLASVFGYFMVKSADETDCYDAMTGQRLSGDACVVAADETVSADGGTAADNGARANANGPGLPFDGETNLVSGQRYWSQSGNHFLVLNPDGNLVVARADGGFVWGLNLFPEVNFRRIARVTWQADGNLAAYDADDQYIWSALHENPDASARLEINADGVLQIIAGNRVMWSASVPLSLREHESHSGGTAPVELAGSMESAGHPAALSKQDHFTQGAPLWLEPVSAYTGAIPARPSAFPQGMGDLPSFGSPSFGRARTASFGRISNSSAIGGSAGSAFAGSAVPMAMMAGGPGVSCQGEGSFKFSLAPKIEPLKNFSFELSNFELEWDIEVGVKASFKPSVEISGSYGCTLTLAEINVPIGGAAVPISLRLRPQLTAEASATVSLSGPSFGVEVGIKSEGSIYDHTYDCGWTGLFCSHEIGIDTDTNPFARFTRGSASANLAGTLTFTAGVDANLGFGYSIGIAKARAGLTVVVSPLSAELKAQAGTDSCVSASVGYQLEAKLVAEAYLPLILDEERELPLYESDHQAYPGAEFSLGDCGD